MGLYIRDFKRGTKYQTFRFIIDFAYLEQLKKKKNVFCVTQQTEGVKMGVEMSG